MASVNGELIYRALENVIRNAITHTRPGTAVHVASKVMDRQLVVTIEDDGQGVPAAELEVTFKPFSQSSTVTTRSGFGLGLAIARRAAEWHGGGAWAENRTAGELRVFITLPARHPGTGSGLIKSAVFRSYRASIIKVSGLAR
ncbi:ATP-binding protein [Agrobacterium sp. 33MFTa1.1]|uniref:ATP-binding protein n=1 Tax=Agrobacterium sp. 33MFTa1.1 TaxID=1279031 RepID=UPI000B254938|nr:ATP-binding protein [Agrobacterium sp. 33MFTa1.1]